MSDENENLYQRRGAAALAGRVKRTAAALTAALEEVAALKERVAELDEERQHASGNQDALAKECQGLRENLAAAAAELEELRAIAVEVKDSTPTNEQIGDILVATKTYRDFLADDDRGNELLAIRWSLADVLEAHHIAAEKYPDESVGLVEPDWFLAAVYLVTHCPDLAEADALSDTVVAAISASRCVTIGPLYPQIDDEEEEVDEQPAESPDHQGEQESGVPGDEPESRSGDRYDE